MSTRCRIEFYRKKFKGEEPAISFRRSDGYPAEVIPQLQKLEKLLGLHSHEPRYAAACDLGAMDYVYRVVCRKEGWQIFVFTEDRNGELTDVTAEALAEAGVTIR